MDELQRITYRQPPTTTTEIGSYLTGLPFDLKDGIVSLIDSPCDLAALAATSTEWAHLIMPQHIEYRRLHLTHPRTTVWAHLAQRADLAQHIRDVRISELPFGFEPDSFPGTLPEPEDWKLIFSAALNQGPDQIQKEHDIVQALANMRNLRRFWWRLVPILFSVVPKKGRERIWKVLSRSQTLVDLRLEDVSCGKLLGLLEQDDDGEIGKDIPLWHIKDLHSLTLTGEYWSRWKCESRLTSMLERSPYLSELTISYLGDSPSFRGCNFPHLRKLHLLGVLHGDENADTLIIEFLSSHPTIEDLKWNPISRTVSTPPGMLPGLKHIDSSHGFVTSLLRDHTLSQKRALESISQLSLGDRTMQTLENINGSQLRRLFIWRFDAMEMIYRVAELFPALTTLEIPHLGVPSGSVEYTMEDYIYTLSRFPALEYLADSAIWLILRGLGSEQQKRDTISSLARQCPRLMRLKYHDSIKNIEADIVIVRNGEEVRLEEQPDRWNS